jgi:hypothetical protein
MAAVSQNLSWKLVLLDLWRSQRCASSAPGQPPHRPSSSSLRSGVRRWPRRAADLSSA